MNIPFHKTIKAKDGNDFYKQIAAFSFEGFIEHGVGAVVIQEGAFKKDADGRVEADVLYVPYDADKPENAMLPAEAVAMIDAYEPESDVVLAIVGMDGTAICLTLSAEKIGCSPVVAYMKGRDWHVDIEPGSVLRLKESIGGIESGVFVFLREEKAMMKLARAIMDADEGEVMASDEEVDVHVDFRDAFVSMDMNVYYGRGK